MRGRVKISTALIITLILVLSMFVPTIRVMANNLNAPESEVFTYILSFTVKPGTEHTILIDDEHLKIDGQYVEVRNNKNENISVASKDGDVYKLTVTDGPAGQLNFNDAHSFTLYMQGHELDRNMWMTANEDFLVQDYEEHQGGNHHNPEQPGNTEATVILRGGTGSYTGMRYNPTTDKMEEVQIPYAETYYRARITINDREVFFPGIDEQNIPDNLTLSDFTYDYDANQYEGVNQGKVKISICSIFDTKFDGNVVVNGVNYKVSDYIDYTDREEWLDHYDMQSIAFDIYVAKAATYDITVNASEATQETCFIANFLWTADSNQEYRTYTNWETGEVEFEIDPLTGEKIPNDDYIGHSTIQLIKVEYERNGQTVTADFSKQETLAQMDRGQGEFGPGNIYQQYSDGDVEYGKQLKENGQVINYDEGSLVVPEGALITMKIVPEYGYQVTSFDINGGAVVTGDNISEFTFPVHAGNAHIGAKVKKVENVVDTTTNSIKGGTITIADNEIASGSVRLSVKNSEPNEEKVAQFQEKIGEEYKVSEYLDISLAQVIYKGSADKVWTTEMEDLNSAARISLELDEEFDAENTKIVHNIHNGDTFEDIEYEYDEDTKTLSFDTDSFSDYAIVTKVSKNNNNNNNTTTDKTATNTATNTANNPKTGDSIAIVVSTLAVAIAVFSLTIVKKRNMIAKCKHKKQ